MSPISDAPTALSREVIEAKNDVQRLLHIIPNLFLLCLLTTLLAFRIKNLSWRGLKSINFIRLTVLLTHVFGIGFIIANMIVVEGVGVKSAGGCHSAIIVCATFYIIVKVLMYVFLIERAQVVSAAYRNRLKDKFWIVCMVFLVGGIIPITVMAYVTPIAAVSPTDGQCRIGFQERTSLLILIWDVCMNLLISGVFCYLLYPFLTQQSQFIHQPDCHRRLCIGRAKSCRHQKDVFSKLRKLLDKTIVGSTVMLIATVGNLFISLKMDGHQLVWFCFLMCPLDVTLTVTVIHLLTVDPSATESHTRVQPKPTTRAPILTPVIHDVTCLSFPEVDMKHQDEGSWCEERTIYETVIKGSFTTRTTEMDTESNVMGVVSSQGHRRRSI